MVRSRNTMRSGGGFSVATIQAVWNKATVVPGWDSTKVRKDRCGAIIRRDKYGDTDSTHGWEIDHDVPVSRNGSDDLSNLQPLQWENNRHKGDSFPSWYCAVTAA